MDISIEFKLNIFPNVRGGIIWVPGCEPTSALSSPTINENLRNECGNAFVYVDDVLDAIPGSKIIFVNNMEVAGGSKILVLPGKTPECPCSTVQDWYGVLKELARNTSDDDCEISPIPNGIGRYTSENDNWRSTSQCVENNSDNIAFGDVYDS